MRSEKHKGATRVHLLKVLVEGLRLGHVLLRDTYPWLLEGFSHI